jgi:hypothetical protein
VVIFSKLRNLNLCISNFFFNTDADNANYIAAIAGLKKKLRAAGETVADLPEDGKQNTTTTTSTSASSSSSSNTSSYANAAKSAPGAGAEAAAGMVYIRFSCY